MHVAPQIFSGGTWAISETNGLMGLGWKSLKVHLI